MGTPLDRPATEATSLGSYEILGKLARGGMAELFLAQAADRIVVIKKILPKYAANPKFVKLFLDEARIAAELDHPHIARVYELGSEHGDYFFAMEYVHGKDVRSTLRRTTSENKKFPLEHAILIARDTAAALHYAHERRRPDDTLLDIVHRDVSPSNIIISYDGAVKLVDFGVAKAASNSARTRTGTLKGKISYMSPEQAKGAPVDRRSDIFSLGIVLWEMVTSCRLFRRDNDLATIQMIINSKPQPPTELRPECPPELERIALKALAAEPAQRYQTAEELQRDLEALELTPSTTALHDFMHKAFAPELEAWREAQESGHTVMDAAMFGDTTLPVSENELEYIDDELDEDDEPDSSVEMAAALAPRLGTIDPPTAPWAVQSPGTQPMPAVMVARADHTPVPAPQPPQQPQAQFPRAPKEWLQPVDPVAPLDEPMQRHMRNIKISAIVIVVLIVLIAVIFSPMTVTSASRP